MRKKKRMFLRRMLLMVLSFFIFFGTAFPTSTHAADFANTTYKTAEWVFLSAYMSVKDSWNKMTDGWTVATEKSNGSKELTENKQSLPVKETIPKGKKVNDPKRVKELVEQRKINAKFYELSDGRIEAEISSDPVHYRDSDGKLQDIQNDISKAKQKGYVYSNEKNQFKTHFSDRANELVKITSGKHAISMGLKNPDKSKVAPTVKGNMISFPDVWNKSKIEYQTENSKVKERIVLNEKPESNVFDFVLEMGDLEPKLQSDGSVLFVDKGDVGVFKIPKPFMYDSKKEEDSPYGYAWSHDVKQEIVQVDGKNILRVTANKEWLNDEKRVMPLTIDPTLEIQPTPGNGAQSSKDTMINSSSPTTNYNDNWRLSVGADSSQTSRSLVKFDTSVIPSGSKVDFAQVQLYYDQNFCSGCKDTDQDVTFSLHRVLQDWNPSEATWKEAKKGEAWKTPGGTFRSDVEASTYVIDNTDSTGITKNGTWNLSSNVSGGVNGSYHAAQPNDKSATNTFTWKPYLNESGTYNVAASNVKASDRATSAPYNITHNGGTSKVYLNQRTANTGYQWLGQFRFATGDSHSITLSNYDSNKKVDGAVIADAIRFTKVAEVDKSANVNNRWHDYTARDLVQSWVDGSQENYGVLIKAKDESKKVGGIRYTASQNFDENSIRPKLKVVYGKPSVLLAEPTKIYANGAELKWTKYIRTDFVEYQIHRSTNQSFTPDETTLVAPIPNQNTLTFTDTTATPTPAYSSDPFGRAYFYQIAVKTVDGTIVPSTTQLVRLPKSGMAIQILQNAIDTTISSEHKSTSFNYLDEKGNPWASVGNNSATFGNTRSLYKFDLSSIPNTAKVVDADFSLWSWQRDSVGSKHATYNAHYLWKDFESVPKTTWNSHNDAFHHSVLDYVTNVTNDPKWLNWDVTTAAERWVKDGSSNRGLMIRHSDEGSKTAKEKLLTVSSEMTLAPQLKPKLKVVYIDKKAANSYYSPKTPTTMKAGETYPVEMTLSNPTDTAWSGSTDSLGCHWALPNGTDRTTEDNCVGAEFKPIDAEGNESVATVNIPPGDTITVRGRVKAPAISQPNKLREGLILQWDLKLNGTWLSKSKDPIPTLNQFVMVEDPNGGKDLGVDQNHASTDGKTSGTGINLYRGNASFSYAAFENPSRGDFSTSVNLTYNSLDTSDSPIGVGWSLDTSSFVRLGASLGDQVYTDKQDKITRGSMDLMDSDGTNHTFTWDEKAKEFKSQPGDELYLQYLSGGASSRKWIVTEPDRTQYYFDDKGYLVEATDQNGNNLRYTYEEKSVNNKPIKLLRYVTDSQNRQTLTIEYNDNHKVSKIKALQPTATETPQRVIEFTYDASNRLTKFVDGVGTNIAKTYEFVYDLLSTNVINQIKDPRGNVTKIDYYTDGDNKHRVSKMSNKKDEVMLYTYNDKERTETDLKGNSTKYLMDDKGDPVKVTDAKGNVTEFKYDQNHNMTWKKDPNGGITTWTYDELGNVLTTTDPVNNAISDESKRKSTRYDYQYSLNKHVAELIKTTTPEGRFTKTTYDEVGNVVSVEDTEGNKTTTAYHGNSGLVKSVTDSNGKVTTYGDPSATDFGYDANGEAKKETDALGNTTVTQYDDFGNVIKVTDPKGSIATFTFDVFGRPLESKMSKDQAKGEFITTPAPIYDANDNVVEKLSPTGAKFVYKYDEYDRLVEEIEPKDHPSDPERKTTYFYDELGNLIKEVEPKGNLTDDPNDYTTTHTYNELNQLIAVTNSQGHKITYEYDKIGNQTKVTQPKGNQTADNPNDYVVTTMYDLNNRPIKVTDADGKSIETVYDADGKTVQTKDKEGNVHKVSYNIRGLVAEEQSPQKAGVTRTTRYTYDKMGNVIQVDPPRGTATPYADDFVQKKTYDDLGRVKEVIFPRDPNSSNPRFKEEQRIMYKYDSVGNVIEVSTPPSEGQTERNISTFTYFDNGLLKTVTDVWGVTTKYDYNQIGNQVERIVTSSDGKVERKMTWDYFPDGKLKRNVDEGLQNKGSSIDAERKQFEYSYDINDNIISMKDSSSNKKVDEYRTSYTPLNQVKEVQEVVDGIVKRSIQYDYDVHGNLLKQEYSNSISEYSYNGLDQVTQFSQKKSAQDNKPQVYGFQYTVSGKTKQETKPNGIVTDYQYNPDGSVAQWESKKTNGTSLQKHVYEYDLHGNPVKDIYAGLDANNKPINNTYAYTYDPRDRLVRYDKSGTQSSTEEYVLDANSNLLQKTRDGVLSTFKYDKNRLIEETEAGLTSKYIYDAMGRIDKITTGGKDKETFAYDQFDRTIEHTKLDKDNVTTIKSRFTYDPLDRTTSKVEKAGTANEKTTAFNYLGNTDQVLSEEVAGKVTQSYSYSAWGQRLTMLKEDTKELSYFESGNNGVEMLTDEKGNIRATYGFTPYGEDDKDMFTGVDKPDPTKPNQDAYNSYRYEGKRWDSNTQSYDLGFRDYRPGEGRFLTSDSYNDAGAHLALMMDTGNYNLYGYTGGNPISNSDPDGHAWWNNWNDFKAGVSSAASAVVSTVSTYAQKAYTAVKEVAKSAYNAGKKFVKKVVAPIKRAIKKVYNKVKKAVKKVVSYTKKAVKKAKSAIKSVTKPKPKSATSSKPSSWVSALRETASWVVAETPILSSVNDAVVLIAGHDFITGEDVPRLYGAIGLFSPISSKEARLGGKMVEAASDQIGGMYRRAANTGAFAGLAEPMQKKNVMKVAKEAGIGLDGIKVKIVRDSSLINRGVFGWANPNGKEIQLYPLAFSDKENLIKTLGHERMHIYQARVFGEAKDQKMLMDFEKAAYGSEDMWWNYARKKR
ncbi:RHS repeat-associated protein [Croceifilum oryzae]|uniref:RHS repeat-associated protein n=1 Tax=Croceifilum oryzae TaxID=1553429 RepID=A0AAJ1TDB6_9BACL|nr:DNRLRE domain-containing protein [Croceifilum oryzae]MDQ0416810.1 RHS repeat-associated protein [Croceifilum oryzae]